MDENEQPGPDTELGPKAFTRGERLAAGFALLVLALLALPALDVLSGGMIFGRTSSDG
jgi:hypothetical protein